MNISIQLPGPNAKYDVRVCSDILGPAAIAVEMMLAAARMKSDGYIVERSGGPDEPHARYMILREMGPCGHAADFLLIDDQLLVCIVSTPSDWTPDRRVASANYALGDLVTAIEQSTKSRIRFQAIDH